MNRTGKYSFPKIQNVTLRNFTLFTKSKDISEEINRGVFCLAGANGLGKTTFLNAINYGLTGIVLEPNKEVYSPSEIIVANKKYTNKYFVGRISNKDKDLAEIELKFQINNKHFRIIRNFFERDSLRLFEIYSEENLQKKSLLHTSNLSPIELNEKYQEELAKEMSISNFDYFIFLQLYVLTFDENRRMIFWDPRASSHALSIAFNTNINDIEKTIDLKRQMENLESHGRNKRWQATQTKNKIKELFQKKKENPDLEKQQEQYELLQREFEVSERDFSNVKTEYNTILKHQSLLNSEIMHLKLERTRLFTMYSEPRSKLLENTFIKISLGKNECCICGSKSNQVVENIKSKLYRPKCPLCDTHINDEESIEQEKILSEIEENDRKISSKNRELENLIIESSGKKLQLEKSEFEFQVIKKKLDEFLDYNPLVTANNTGNQGIDFLIDTYRKQFEELDKESKEAYIKRDKIFIEYKKLQDKVESAYVEAEEVFVPIFIQLAKSFIGLELNIRFEKEKTNQRLVLELQNSARTEHFQLSESQRFFLDIALRMSLAIFLSKKGNEATMLIDTPEGSLDIAYESRVGQMFAFFIKDFKQNILMTANINASQLLISLAEICSSESMKFRRMLDWTDLTVIQKEGEALFEKVYFNIETALKTNYNG